MEREELFKKVAEIISEKLNVPIEDIEEDSHLIEDLGADSLDAFDLVMVFEDEFGIKLEDDEIEKLMTVKDIVDLLQEKLKDRE
ncbi:acyl carrier protein [Fervidobacterium changbaicum]|uniref:Acyl carrier protein n=2 Tax=Fervidobacterium TaxID=2422 RepID=A0AAI8GDL1_FERIS|nr:MULTISPECIES: acyl carrier protein [Fervidobacterium]AMW33128.1 acyl carrier protein [Fervidobacterium islandicum]QAV33169.1 acyl carrier protein [Fervidobacterium changbaicum]SDH12502.1 acyl carrier protein [Fervidobacterium changbaicum]